MSDDTRRVLALDLALGATGVCLPDGRAFEIRTPTKLNTYRRISQLGREVVDLIAAHGVHEVWIEDYAPNSLGRMSTIRAAELQGPIRIHLTEQRIPWATVVPSHLKRWATGNGTAKKAEMIEAASQRGAVWTCTDNEADAFLLRLYALEQAPAVAL